jgi:hypothetical protein
LWCWSLFLHSISRWADDEIEPRRDNDVNCESKIEGG